MSSSRLRTAELGKVALILGGVYVAWAGWLLRRTPGLDLSSCSSNQPCDPSIVLGHSRLGTALVVIGALVALTGVASLLSGRGTGLILSLGRNFFYVGAAVVSAIAVWVTVVIEQSPVSCAAGAAGPCPPSGIGWWLALAGGGLAIASAFVAAGLAGKRQGDRSLSN